MQHIAGVGPRRAQEDAQSGFTLIEMVAVLAILGVLAAIAVPTFLGLQSGARDAAVQADLVHAKTALVAFAAEHQGDPPSFVTRAGSASYASTTVDLVPLGWTIGSSTADLTYVNVSGASWCVLAASTTGAAFRVTSTTGVVRSSSC